MGDLLSFISIFIISNQRCEFNKK